MIISYIDLIKKYRDLQKSFEDRYRYINSKRIPSSDKNKMRVICKRLDKLNEWEDSHLEKIYNF